MKEPRSWYYADGEQIYGPLTVPEIEALIGQAIILPSTWIILEGTEDWMLAQDSPFSDGLQNASPETADQTKAAPDDETGLTPPPPETTQEHGNFLDLFATKVRQNGRSIVTNGKKIVQLAALRAQVEKLKRFDLTEAHYQLEPVMNLKLVF